jgi:hypothetical protein
VFIPASGRRSKIQTMAFGVAHARNTTGTVTIVGRKGSKIHILEITVLYEDDVASAALSITHGATSKFSYVVGTDGVHEGATATGVVFLPENAYDVAESVNAVISITSSGSASIGAFVLVKYQRPLA